ncbi:SCO family protein [Hymenobacter jejuensis]|uniref:SCO family protein n=1 Tax=Hymenobacter jejuensis TaxID=2502781 RepID=A0A5B8A3E1_9BACT|nr:SCO family protein [Hymenobacter jejuensis]QDA61697.1 SCO family protein [Hymenobacter jejuensis]
MKSILLYKYLIISSLSLGSAFLLPACSEKNTADAAANQLPYIGEREVKPRADGGAADTVYATIPNFTLTDQAGKTVTNDTFRGKVYVADFFFATCPSICPKMQSEMLRVYEKYKGDPRVVFLSHTIDPEHDSIPVLRDYAERLGVKDASRWHFATAPHDTIFNLARAYMTGAMRDKQAAGGFAHNGTFALVDPERHVRGLYDGMVPAEVDRLIQELPILLQEVEASKKAK